MRVSTPDNDVAHRWDPVACAAGRDGDGIMLVPGQSLLEVTGAVPRATPNYIPSTFLSSLAQSSHHLRVAFSTKERLLWYTTMSPMFLLLILECLLRSNLNKRSKKQ